MSFILIHIVICLNVVTNGIGAVLLSYTRVLPGWLSITIISAITGIFLLLFFKVTSNQKAIGRVQDKIKANVLALKLFKDSLSVTLGLQVQLFKGAILLLCHAIRPMLIMMVPISLLLGQMSLWYQARPLAPTEETVVTMALKGSLGDPWPEVEITSMPSAEVLTGPVRVTSKRELHWKIKAIEPSEEPIVFRVDQKDLKKHLAVGTGWMRVCPKRPAWKWTDIIRYPLEQPCKPESPVHSIRIKYPDRLSQVSGTDSWLITFFISAMVFAFLAKPILKVKV